MISPEPSAPRRPGRSRRRWLRIGLFALLALGFPVAVALGYRAYFLSKAVRQVEEATAELDRTAPGWRWEDILAGSKPLPPEANSAPLVVAAASRLPEDWPDRRAAAPGRAGGVAATPDAQDADELEQDSLVDLLDQLDPVVKLDDAYAADLRAEWEALTPALTEALKLADGPSEGRHEIAWERNPFVTNRPEMLQTRLASSLLRLDAAVRAHENDAAGALAATRGAVKAARALDYVNLITLLVREAVISRALKALERTLGQTEPRADALIPAQRLLELEREGADRLLLAAIRAERAMFFQAFGLAADGHISIEGLDRIENSPLPAWDEFRHWLYIRPRLRHCQDAALREITRLVEILAQPAADQVDALQGYVDEMQAREADLSRRADWRMLSVMFMPTLATGGIGHHQHCHQLEAAILALAAERFRLERGRWPESLEDLVPAYAAGVPKDRFGPGNLRLARREDGIVIYSVGQDQKDDGGAIERQDEGQDDVEDSPGGRDLGFRLWDPDKRRQ